MLVIPYCDVRYSIIDRSNSVLEFAEVREARNFRVTVRRISDSWVFQVSHEDADMQISCFCIKSSFELRASIYRLTLSILGILQSLPVC